MRTGWLVTVLCLMLGAAGSALAQGSNREDDRRTDASHPHRRMYPMGEMKDGQHPSPRRRAQIREMRERYRDATPERRREMRVERLARFEFHERRNRALAGMSREERAALRAEVRALPAEERHELRRKLRHFHSLPQSEQAELKQRFGALRSLDSAEQEQIEHNTERWNQMAPHQREELRATWKRFRELPPDLQQEVLDRALLEASPGPPPR